jgi:hypothetical protein
MTTTEEEAKALEPETVAADETEPESGAGEEQVEEVIVSIGEPAEPPQEEEARAPEWVRELRRKHRETTKELAETKKKLESLTAEPKPATLGKKPTLEDCDYDSDKYESELTEWFECKRAADDQEAKARQADEAAKADWQAKLDNYGKAKAELKIADFDEAEAEAMDLFNTIQQGIVIQGADNPALVVYALGKNPTQAKDLAAITDPVKFSFAVAKLEAQLKVTKKNRTTPQPERTIQGTGRISGTVDSTLDRLRDDAAKTGDYSKVMQYKAQQRKKT